MNAQKTDIDFINVSMVLSSISLLLSVRVVLGERKPSSVLRNPFIYSANLTAFMKDIGVSSTYTNKRIIFLPTKFSLARAKQLVNEGGRWHGSLERGRERGEGAYN